MKLQISFFPRHSLESMDLSLLRLICSRTQEFCYDLTILNQINFLKWEQIMTLQSFTRQTILQKEMNRVNFQVFEELFKIQKISSRRLYRFDFGELQNHSLDYLLGSPEPLLVDNFFKDRGPKSGLYLGNSRTLLKVTTKLSRLNPYCSWTGLNPNIRVQTSMNSYIDSPSKTKCMFLVIK